MLRFFATNNRSTERGFRALYMLFTDSRQSQMRNSEYSSPPYQKTSFFLSWATAREKKTKFSELPVRVQRDR